ncbi:TetR/AcrR family transcriptional regulator [Streptomyces sp. NPDC002536]
MSKGRAPRTSVWLSGKAGAPKHRSSAAGEGLDRERIVAASVRLLDAEGLAKFSMRKLASELGVTAMSVYWYVDNKDDLLEYVMDEVSAEMRVPDPTDESEDWRDQLRLLAFEYRAVLLAHPWMPQLVGQYQNIGPHAMKFADVSLAVMRRCGVPPESMSGAISALFQFVFGYSTAWVLYRERCKAAGLGEEEYYQNVLDAVTNRPDLMETYKESAAMLRARDANPIEQMFTRDFEFGLETVVAGIEVMRDRMLAQQGRQQNA